MRAEGEAIYDAAAEKDLEIRAFLNYIKRKKSTDILTNKIDTIVREIKAREENKEAYMIEHLKIRDHIMEGKRLGRKEQAIEDALVLIRDYKESPEIAAKKMHAPLKKVKERADKV